jgi:mRNA interferase MazF
VARFVKGDVVVLPFPFSDLSNYKRRPALVLADAGSNALLLCQITSQAIRDNYAVQLDVSDFQSGSLKKTSVIRPNRIFTADEHIIEYRAGHINTVVIEKVISNLIGLLQA